MAVQSAFSANVVAGVSPLTVNFTDESTGSPDAWLWDFGDGSSGSEAQHPTHVYEDDGAYTVTLKAYIQTGTTEVLPTRSAELFKFGTASSDESIAWSTFLAAAFSSGGSTILQFLFSWPASNNKVYSARKSTLQFDLTAHSSGLAILKYRIFITESPTDGTTWEIKISGGGIVPDVTVESSGNPGNTDFPNTIAGDVSSRLGTIFAYDISDGNDFTQRVGPGITGVGEWRYRLPGGSPAPARIDVVTYSDLDAEIKENYIVVGPPIADFSAAPVLGSNPLSVSLTDLSLGPVTSYSWRKRKAGTSDAFVEFSTAQNPSSQEFDKTNP